MNWKKDVEQFRSAMKIEVPAMSASFLRIGFFGLTGGGKSVTSGIFAIGLTPSGLIGWIDCEGRRSGYAIDEVCELAAKNYGKPKQSFFERFKVIHVDPPFNPLAGVAAIEALEEAGAKTILFDGCSQLWDSEGGYLDMKEEVIDRMAAGDEGKRQRVAAAAAAGVKPWTHGKFVSKVNSCKAHIILIFQAKNKWNAKTNKVEEFVSPIQESGLTRTALVVGRVECSDKGQGGFCTFQAPPGQGTKYTHNSILKLLPTSSEQLSFTHAQAVAAWCAAPAGPGQTGVIANRDANETERKRLKSKLWHLTVSKHGGKLEGLELWLIGNNLMSDSENVSDLPASRLVEIIEAAPAKLQVNATPV